MDDLLREDVVLVGVVGCARVSVVVRGRRGVRDVAYVEIRNRLKNCIKNTKKYPKNAPKIYQKPKMSIELPP